MKLPIMMQTVEWALRTLRSSHFRSRPEIGRFYNYCLPNLGRWMVVWLQTSTTSPLMKLMHSVQPVMLSPNKVRPDVRLEPGLYSFFGRVLNHWPP